MKVIELKDGKVWTSYEAEVLPVLPKPHKAVALKEGQQEPEHGSVYDEVTGTFSAPEVEQVVIKYKRDHIRNKLSLVSQIKFDKMRSLIDSPDLVNLIPLADNEIEGLAGFTYRDSLRTFLRRWEENSTIHNNDPNFVKAMSLLATLGILTNEERDLVITGG